MASKKVGGAVERNRARRRLRELFRAQQNQLAQGRYILVAKKPILDLAYDALNEQFNRAIRQLTHEKRIKV